MRQSLVFFKAFVGPEKNLLSAVTCVITYCRTEDVNILATHSCLSLRGVPVLCHSLVDILYHGT